MESNQNNQKDPTMLESDPSLEEIWGANGRCMEIQNGWSEEVREQRSSYRRLPACIHNYRFCKLAKTFVAGSCPDAEILTGHLSFRDRLSKAGVW